MKTKDNFGFTLVELLAVLVILAIILVIAVPRIISIIDDVTRSSLESSVNMIANEVENKYTQAKSFGKEFDKTGNCMNDLVSINNDDYGDCKYSIDEKGNAIVTVYGKGKFEKYSTCIGTKKSIILCSKVKEEVQNQEELILNLAKYYVNNIDNSFYSNLNEYGDVNYIYKSELLNSNIINEGHIDKLNDLIGIKGEFLSSNEIKYSVEYINGEDIDYSNESLYNMILDLKNDISELNENITKIEENATFEYSLDDIKEDINKNKASINSNLELINANTNLINNLTNIENTNNIFLKNYPVGSIYISSSSTNPSSLFGGTWIQIKDRFLVGAGNTYKLGDTGGSSTHQHSYGFQYGGYYRTISLESNTNAGLLDFSDSTNFTVTGSGTSLGNFEAPVNTTNSTEYSNLSMKHYQMIAKTSASSSLPPYMAVNIWKRTA